MQLLGVEWVSLAFNFQFFTPLAAVLAVVIGDCGLLMIPLAALNVVIPHFRAVTLSWDWA